MSHAVRPDGASTHCLAPPYKIAALMPRAHNARARSRTQYGQWTSPNPFVQT